MSQSIDALLQKAEIERRAYELYLQSGCVNGRDVENWLAAEEELRNECENRDILAKKKAFVATQLGKVRARRTKLPVN